MSAEPGWVEVKNVKEIRRQERKECQRQKDLYWDDLQKKYPHIVHPSRAQRIARLLQISKLDEKLESEEWVSHQKNGWQYLKVAKPHRLEETLQDLTCSYLILPLDNGWGDQAIFIRIGEDNPEEKIDDLDGKQ